MRFDDCKVNYSTTKKKNYDFQSQFFFFFFFFEKDQSQVQFTKTCIWDFAFGYFYQRTTRYTQCVWHGLFFKKKNYLRGMMKKWKDDKEIFVFSFICLIEGMEKWRMENEYIFFIWLKEKMKESIDNLMWYTIIPQQLFIISLTPLKHYTYKNIGIHTQTLLCG